MNKLWTVLLAFLAIVAWQVAGPYYTVYQIKQAVEQQDSVKLAKYIDFIQLQQNLKHQLQAKFKTRLEQQNGSFFGMLAIATTEKALDSLLDQTVNPATVLLYFNGKRPFQQKLNAIRELAEHQENSENLTASVSQVSFSTPSGSQSSVDHDTAPKTSTVSSSKNWTGQFDNISKFSVLQQRDNGTDIRYLITRSGAGWQLSNIILTSD